VLTLVALFGGAATQGFASAWPLDLPADAASDDARDTFDGDADGDESSALYEAVLGQHSGPLLTLLAFEFIERSGRDGADRRAPLVPPPKSLPPRACDRVLTSRRTALAVREWLDSAAGPSPSARFGRVRPDPFRGRPSDPDSDHFLDLLGAAPVQAQATARQLVLVRRAPCQRARDTQSRPVPVSQPAYSTLQ
jgi:hypothetical protein